jgi:DNA-binding HxlR family transcriptional regulator
MLIVRDAFMGITRFDQFLARLGISRNILNNRLTRLVDQGVLDKLLYSERRPRYEYRLTAKGRDL